MDAGNKQGTSNHGIQPPTTIISITWIHARRGQPLAVTLNGTVRGLTYKQEAGGSSPSPPMSKALQNRRFGGSGLVFAGRDHAEWVLGTSVSSLSWHPMPERLGSRRVERQPVEFAVASRALR